MIQNRYTTTNQEPITKITQLVPKLPPDVDGLGDYALNLAYQLRQDYGITTDFLVGNPAWQGEGEVAGFRAVRLRERSTRGLLEVLGEQPLLLNYEGYGYAKRGYPRWLLQGLKRWKRDSQQRLVTMFHEVYPYHQKPIWTSGFWLTPLQRGLVVQLTQMSDRILTSKQSYATLLQHLSQGYHSQVPSLPVFCNIGEPQDLLPLSQRLPRLIVFGHYNSRRQVYADYLPVLEQVCQVLKITEILDIGVPTGIKLPSVNGYPVQELGITPAEKISELMQQSLAGFLSFIPPDYLAKSGVYSAYCAHKMIPLVTTKGKHNSDGLHPQKHYWIATLNPHDLTLETGQIIANYAHTWYHTHNRAIHAQQLVDFLF
ncbi:MAG: glycosyltransferase family 1 protein [Kamptonema sp. SIO4C4]|nr:glycosyltransferase family 1 protein [Kamptonema sp. SIO4C4]